MRRDTLAQTEFLLLANIISATRNTFINLIKMNMTNYAFNAFDKCNKNVIRTIHEYFL